MMRKKCEEIFGPICRHQVRRHGGERLTGSVHVLIFYVYSDGLSAHVPR
jgi:hypothetical protein